MGVEYQAGSPWSLHPTGMKRFSSHLHPSLSDMRCPEELCPRGFFAVQTWGRSLQPPSLGSFMVAVDGAAGVARALLCRFWGPIPDTAECRMSLRRCRSPTPGIGHNQILGQGELPTGLSRESLAEEGKGIPTMVTKGKGRCKHTTLKPTSVLYSMTSPFSGNSLPTSNSLAQDPSDLPPTPSFQVS